MRFKTISFCSRGVEDRAAHDAKRMKMKLFFIITVILIFNSSILFADQDTSYQQAKAQFYELKIQWDKEGPKYSSNTKDYRKGDAAKSILKMEKKALPFIFSAIEKGNIFFNVAAEKITQITLKNESINSEQAHSKLWMKWWTQNKNNSKWNIFLGHQVRPGVVH